MTTITIPTALSQYKGALSTYEATKAELHKAHINADGLCSTALSTEAAAAQTTVGASSDLGLNALNGELALVATAFGVGSLTKDGAAAKIVALDASLKNLEDARVALDAARAALDTAVDGERTRALALRAKLAGISGSDTKKS